MSLITYHIVSDYRGMLHASARQACSFWNRFVEPSSSTVLRLGTFEQFGNTIARAYRPYQRDGVKYGRVEFNTKYLDQFEEDEIVGTLIHEIGHTLGVGWNKWMDMFSHRTGRFHKRWIKKLAALENMLVETDFGPGTTLAHWDEENFEKELMSGFKSDDEYVMPVTIDVMGLLGHAIIERLEEKRKLKEILDDLRNVVFTRQADVLQIVRDAFVETEIWEEIYENKRVSF